MNRPLERSILQALRPSQERAKLCLAPARAFTEKTVAEICDLIAADPTISPAYKEAIRYDKASDWSVRKVGDVLAIKAKWDELRADFATIAHGKLALAQLEEMDTAAHMILSERVEIVTADEKME